MSHFITSTLQKKDFHEKRKLQRSLYNKFPDKLKAIDNSLKIDIFTIQQAPKELLQVIRSFRCDIKLCDNIKRFIAYYMREYAFMSEFNVSVVFFHKANQVKRKTTCDEL